jgi:hypothetical protein
MPKRVNGKGKLQDKGWKHDGLWWISPYSQHRYMLKEALAVEELRVWGVSDSAILGDKNHSMWVLKEIDDNALTTMDDLSKTCHQRRILSDRASRSNLKGEGTD